VIGHADAEWLVYAIISHGTSIGSGIDVRFAPIVLKNSTVEAEGDR
jgi:hypothetical protein